MESSPGGVLRKCSGEAPAMTRQPFRNCLALGRKQPYRNCLALGRNQPYRNCLALGPSQPYRNCLVLVINNLTGTAPLFPCSTNSFFSTPLHSFCSFPPFCRSFL